MTVKQLKEALVGLPDEMECVTYADSEYGESEFETIESLTVKQFNCYRYDSHPEYEPTVVTYVLEPHTGHTKIGEVQKVLIA